MKFSEAISACPVRGAIFRLGDKIRYFKNHPISLEEQVPMLDQENEDWAIYDPRDDDETSLFMFND